MQLTTQQQDVILALHRELDYYQRRAGEVQEKISLLLVGLGVDKFNLMLVPVEPPAPIAPPPAPTPSPAPPNS